MDRVAVDMLKSLETMSGTAVHTSAVEWEDLKLLEIWKKMPRWSAKLLSICSKILLM